VLAGLDPLRDLDLTLAREERDAPHLAEVHADGVVGLRVVVDVLFLVLGRDDELLVARLLVGDALGLVGLADGLGALDDGTGVGDGGAGIVDVGEGLGVGESDGDVDGVPPVLLDGVGESVELGVGVADVELEGVSEPLGVGVTSARAGRASVRQTTAVNAATALRRATR
jgi:hypothetical protein